MSDDVLKTHVPDWVFREIKAAARPIVQVVSTGTKETLTFMPSFASDGPQERNGRGWPVRRWRGQPTA